MEVVFLLSLSGYYRVTRKRPDEVIRGYAAKLVPSSNLIEVRIFDEAALAWWCATLEQHINQETDTSPTAEFDVICQIHGRLHRCLQEYRRNGRLTEVVPPPPIPETPAEEVQNLPSREDYDRMLLGWGRNA